MSWTIKKQLKSTDYQIRMKAIKSIVDTKDSEAVDQLVEMLNDPDPRVRQAAVIGLGDLRDRRSVDRLIVSLDDRDIKVRQNAIVSLKKIGDIRSVEAITPMLQDDEQIIRDTAARTLAEFGDKNAIIPLFSMLRDGDRLDQQSAVDALSSLSRIPYSSPTPAEKSIDDFSIKTSIAQALGYDENVQPLLEILNNVESLEAKEKASKALDQLGWKDGMHKSRRQIAQNWWRDVIV